MENACFGLKCATLSHSIDDVFEGTRIQSSFLAGQSCDLWEAKIET